MYILFFCLGECKNAPIIPHFIINYDWHITGKPEGRCLPWIITPLVQMQLGYVRVLKNTIIMNYLGSSPDPKSILQEMVFL